ncbi:hypothetical protein QYF61_010443 [Mycteria americana]|uniref:Uncharacterized protein n=1 Tax=Mycteria americana TaxID=33587 RepID=A0AAN7N1F5_MYCAM|nr:hypothetical protein QYF61_010443 [Mycteria americana]
MQPGSIIKDIDDPANHTTLPAEQPKLSQPILVGEVLQPSDHFCGPPLDPLQQLHVLLVLRAPELDAVLQPWIRLAFWAASAHCQLMSSFFQKPQTNSVNQHGPGISDGVGKSKGCLELILLRDVKTNKDFYKNFSSKKKTRENVGLLLNGAVDLVTKNVEEANPLLVRSAFRNPRPLRPEVWSKKTPLVEENQAMEHLNKLDIHNSMKPGPWKVMRRVILEAISRYMKDKKVNKGKCKILPMERNNLIHAAGQPAGQHRCREGPGDPGGQQAEHDQQCTLQANSSLDCMRKRVASKAREAILPFFLSALVKPQPEYCAQFCAPHYKRDMDFLKQLNGGNEEEGDRLFSVVPSDRPRGNGHTLKHEKYNLNIRKNKFILRMIKLCNRLPREVVESPTLQIFKVQLDMKHNYCKLADTSDGCAVIWREIVRLENWANSNLM